MLIKLSDFSPEDMGLYFKDTIVRLCVGGKKPEWVNYRESTSKGFRFCTGINGAKHNKSCCRHIDKKMVAALDVKYPMGFYNTQSGVLYCERLGRRHPLKGLCKHNMKIVSIEGLLMESNLFEGSPAFFTHLRYLSEKNSKLTAQMAADAFETPRYFSVKGAVIDIRKNKVFGRALSSDFMLVPHNTNKEDFLLFFHDRVVAELVDKNKIRLLVPEMGQEVCDFIVPQGLSLLKGKEQ